MDKLVALSFLSVMFFGCTSETVRYKGIGEDILSPAQDSIVKDTIVYHPVRVDQNGLILPWYAANAGQSYDHILSLVWKFWKNMETDSNGLKYYMNHQVWAPNHDHRGLGGDQLMMALSSWNLYYDYTGDSSLIADMRYMADHYLGHSLSPSDSKWPDLPFPYNMTIHSGIYDGDMILGEGFLQPDKAGSFGYELIHLYKKTGDEKYLNAAIKIANTLADKVQPGDQDHSPWPFKVNAHTGETGVLIEKETWYEGMDKDIKRSKAPAKHSAYTTFWTGALNMFKELIQLNKGNTDAYKKAFDITLKWMKEFPARNNKWGPFFEDIPRWSDTQINAITYVMYLLEHPELDADWESTARNILQWVYKELGNAQYAKYGVTCIDEQTAYRVPGNSHTARQASVDLMFWEKTGDTSSINNAVRQLNWATYMVDDDGKNFYPTNAIWMTDGYGDYTRHYLRAMAAAPQLAPDNADHLLRSSSIVQKIVYGSKGITYATFDTSSRELFRLRAKPAGVSVDGVALREMDGEAAEGWSWQSLPKGGVLKITHTRGSQITIF